MIPERNHCVGYDFPQSEAVQIQFSIFVDVKTEQKKKHLQMVYSCQVDKKISKTDVFYFNKLKKGRRAKVFVTNLYLFENGR